MNVVPDTNVRIELFRNPAKKAEFEARTRRPLLYMSSVVALELFAGCRTEWQRASISGFLKPFEKAGRVVTPDHASYQQAGKALAKLGEAGMGIAARRQIVNDVMIAVTAARFGAVVVAANVHDFALIEKHVPVRWMRF